MAIVEKTTQEYNLTRGFGYVSEATFIMCGNPNKVFPTDNSSQLTFRFTCRAGETGGAKGAMAPPLFFKAKKKKNNNNNRNNLKIHNITP